MSAVSIRKKTARDKSASDMVYINSKGNTDFYQNDGKISRQKAHHIKNVLSSGVPISSEFKNLALNISKTISRKDDREKFIIDVNQAQVNDGFYASYKPDDYTKSIINKIKPLKSVDLSALELTKEADDLELSHIKETIIKEEEEELTGMRSTPKVEFVPIVKVSGAKAIGIYTIILNDVMARNKFDAAQQAAIYDTLLTEEDIETFVKLNGNPDDRNRFSYTKNSPAITTSPIPPITTPIVPSPPTTTIVPSPSLTPVPFPTIGGTSPLLATSTATIPPLTIPPIPIVPQSTQNQQQPLLKSSGENIILNNVRADRFHPVEIEWFFGSRDIPEWDKTLEQQVLSSHLTKEEIISKMEMILRSTGDKMGIDDHKGHTLEELNELQQLHFCVIRALQRGSRFKTANIKLNDLQSLMAVVDPEKQSSDQPKIITQPPTTSNPVVLSVPEQEQKFQKAINTSKFDLSGRDISSVGNINNTKLVYSGNFDEKGLRPNNISIKGPQMSSRPRNKKY